MRELLRYLFQYKGYLFIGFICIIINSLCKIALPWMGKMLLDNLHTKDISYILEILSLSLGLSLILAISRYGESLFLNIIGEKVVFDIRCEIFNHLMDFSGSFYEKEKKGNIISRITNDVLILKNFLCNECLSIIKDPIVIIGSILVLFYLNWQMAIFVLLIIPPIAKIIYKFGKKMKDITLLCQRKLAELIGIAVETIHNIKIVHLFSTEEKEKERFKRKNIEYFSFVKKGIKLSSISGPLVELLGTIGIILLTCYGGWQVISGNLTQGGLVAFLFYIGTISSPLKSITKANLVINQAISALNHIFELLENKEIKEDKSRIPLKIKEGRIKIKDLYFSYSGNNILSSINLEILPGEFLGIVGPSGSGKTTLANLIIGFYKPERGSITIDDIDIKAVTTRSLRKNIGFVPQETILFSGTIAENIGYGLLSFSQDEIEMAASLAHCDFIKNLPQGYNTEIGEYGIKLSQGQRQRIAIARALIMKPKILILDEVTSNLDYYSERKILLVFEEILSLKTTLIVISHRLSAITNAHRIIVMEQGRIVEEGDHKTLMRKGGLYKRLYDAYEGADFREYN